MEPANETIHQLPCGAFSVPYYIRFSARARRLQMRFVHKKLEVVVPNGMSTATIKKFIHQNLSWIEKQYHRLRQDIVRHFPAQCEPGAQVIIQGQRYKLDFTMGASCQTCASDRTVCVAVDPKTSVNAFQVQYRKALISYLQRFAQQAAEQMAYRWTDVLGRSPRSVKVRWTSSRWGSCGIHGDIYINWTLIMAPEFVLSYVVLHELCHLFYRSHGVRFWQKVAKAMPDYKEAEHWLRHKGYCLTVEKTL